MFESIVITPFALRRHRSAPLARERALFLAYLQRGGTGLVNLRITAAYLLQIVRFLKLRSPRDVAPDEVLCAAKCWARYKGQHRQGPSGRWSE